MTNEEAIKLIDDRMCFGRGRWSEHHRPVIDEYWQAGEMAIKALEAEPHWIPVTERLPNRNELVLVTYKTTSKIHLCKYFDDGSENSWWSYIDDCCAWNNVILAWMPLPEPFKEVTE